MADASVIQAALEPPPIPQAIPNGINWLKTCPDVGGRDFAADEISNAMQWGLYYLNDRKPPGVLSAGFGPYKTAEYFPKVNIGQTIKVCTGKFQYEWPLLPGGTVFNTSMDPGPYRVAFSAGKDPVVMCDLIDYENTEFGERCL